MLHSRHKLERIDRGHALPRCESIHMCLVLRRRGISLSGHPVAVRSPSFVYPFFLQERALTNCLQDSATASPPPRCSRQNITTPTAPSPATSPTRTWGAAASTRITSCSSTTTTPSPAWPATVLITATPRPRVCSLVGHRRRRLKLPRTSARLDRAPRW